MPENNVQFLWATPIISVTNPGHSAIKEALVRHAYESEKASGARIDSGVAPAYKSGLYESKFDLFKRNIPQVQALYQFCRQALGETFVTLRRHVAPDSPLPDQVLIDIHESWLHITRDGGYHDSHIHANCSWCGIYYIDVGDCTAAIPPNGVNRFYPPITLHYEDLGSTAYPMEGVHPAPADGMLILFPSYIRHSGILYRGQRDRILCAFNARILYPGQAPIAPAPPIH